MNKPLSLEEMIDCESYYLLADYHYTDEIRNSYLPPGVIHCDMGSIPEFFDHIKNLPEKYVVISSRCDFGLHYQRQFSPWMDYSKLAKQILGPNNTQNGYANITLPAPINVKRCNPNDKYSIKCYRYTEATFNEIPQNVVHWFVTNNTIYDDPRITSIPFGINGVDGNQEPKQKIFEKTQSINWFGDRPYDMYVNFQFYTNERMELFSLYKQEQFGMVEKDISFDWYIDNMAQHNCVLCPPGNGWDCYRTLEALYLGCIPIMEFNLGTYFYSKTKLPIVFLNSLENIDEYKLKRIRNSLYSNRKQWLLNFVSLSYWKNEIEQKRKLLG